MKSSYKLVVPFSSTEQVLYFTFLIFIDLVWSSKDKAVNIRHATKSWFTVLLLTKS